MSDKLIHARMLPSQQVRWYKTALRRSKTSLGSQSERRDKINERMCQVLCLLVEAHIKMGNVAAAVREIERQKPVIRTCNETYRLPQGRVFEQDQALLLRVIVTVSDAPRCEGTILR